MNTAWWVDEKQLDDEQSEIIELPIGKSYAVFGPPGSGKSNLLLLRGNYIYLAGHKDIQIVVFTRTLQEFIASGGAQYQFPVSKVKTSTKFGQDLLYQYGKHTTLPDAFEDRRKALVKEIDDLIDTKKLGPLYDTILLDEAQDYWPEEIKMFSRLSKRLFVSADSHQKIYVGRDSLDTVLSVVDDSRTLKFHYRIGSNICKVADALAKDTAGYVPLLPDCQYKESNMPSKVERVRCNTLDAQIEKVLSSVNLQLKTYPDELLGIMCPTREVLDQLKTAVENSDISPAATIQGGDTIDFGESTRVSVSTIHAAKGLEFRTVHIVGAEDLKKFQHQRNMAFTAVTRAKTTLSVYHTSDLPGYFENALEMVEPAKSLPNISRVFGRKKK